MTKTVFTDSPQPFTPAALRPGSGLDAIDVRRPLEVLEAAARAERRADSRGLRPNRFRGAGKRLDEAKAAAARRADLQRQRDEDAAGDAILAALEQLDGVLAETWAVEQRIEEIDDGLGDAAQVTDHATLAVERADAGHRLQALRQMAVDWNAAFPALREAIRE